MAYDIKNVRDIPSLINYFSETLNWNIDIDDFENIEDITYDFEAEDIGLKEESFVRISALRQLQPLVDNQQWGIFCVEFDSNKFEPSALKKILSGLIPRKRNSADHAVWCQQDLLFICNWGKDNNSTIGLAHFEDKEGGLPQIKMFSCAPALEDFTQINQFEQRLSKLAWPSDTSNIEEWRKSWASAFTLAYKQNIQDASTLTVRLAVEAQNIRNRILEIMEVETQNGYVHKLYEKFKNTLIHDMTEIQFADMYAQTVVYGLFSARCMDQTQDTFSASEAVECIPNTNPFLKNLMSECLGAESTSLLSFDELEIGNVVDLLLHTRTDSIIQDFNRQTGGGREDPVIHFYEEFLTAYDKSQKVQRGVYYTPQPVVNFIVRAVDDILKQEFGYEDGLASTETKKIKIKRDSKRKNRKGFITEVEDTIEVPAVQILDPATGTGTFPRQIILQIYQNFFEKNKNKTKEQIHSDWNNYVDQHLLPRLNAFELMMAPYSVAHMKLAMTLKDTGYEFKGHNRLNVYLTNSLEEPGDADIQGSLWDDPLALESVSANQIKKNKGINIVIGNPPYNVSSSNKNPWIQELLLDFKKGLTEKKLNLDDDYIKFIKYAQHLVEESGEGIVAYITNNSFIDGITHRRIRESLLDSFEQIYIIDLHGNVMKQEKCFDGSKDENVFDIQQGVSIEIFVKKQGINKFIKHYDLMGTRDKKYTTLSNIFLNDMKWNHLTPGPSRYLFIPFENNKTIEYEKGFKVTDLFTIYNSGIQTKCDEISVQNSVNELNEMICKFKENNISSLKQLFPKKKDGRDWTFELARKDILYNDAVITPYYYRPFEIKYIRYSGQTKGLIAYPRREIMNNIVGHDNVSLCMMKQFFQDTIYNHIFVSNLPIDERFLYSNRGGTYIFPLYQYSGEIGESKTYNFNSKIVKKVEESLGMNLDFEESEKCFTGMELIEYIYAVLHSNKYRKKFNDQLKYDFPSIPYPTSIEYFRKMAKYGKKLMDIHLPDNYYPQEISKTVLDELVSYKFIGNNVVLNGSIYIDAIEGIDKIQMGGYCPATKWLKDKKGLRITEDDIKIYEKIIDAIKNTLLLVEEIDKCINI